MKVSMRGRHTSTHPASVYMKTSTKRFEKTRYPDLFKDTDWGRSEVIDPDVIPEDIYNNRNSLVETYGITAFVPPARVPQGLKHFYSHPDVCMFDNVEVYVTKEGLYIVLNSPGSEDIFYVNALLRCKWHKISKMCHPKCSTYIRVFKGE